MCIESPTSAQGCARLSRSIVYLPSPYAACASCLAREEPMPSQRALTPSPVMSQPHPALLAGGTKRKLDEMEPRPTYTDQRQSVLNISMLKLRSPPTRRVEQSLRRSVLIFNTLKYIETELYGEGVSLNPASPKPCLLPTEPHNPDLDPPPEVAVTPIAASTPPARACELETPSDCVVTKTSEAGASAPMESSECYAPASESPVPASVPASNGSGQQPSTASCHSNSTWSAMDTCCSPEARSLLDSFFNSSSKLANFSLFDMDSTNSSSSTYNTYNANKTQSSLPTSCHSNQAFSQPKNFFATGGSSGSNSYMSESDILSDLDLSWLDFDLFTPLSNSVKLPSLSADDLSHTLLPGAANIGGSHDPILGLSTTPTCNPKKDLLAEDLDHVMEILVGM